MRPGILPTASGVYQLERKNKIRESQGTLVRCLVCDRSFAPERRSKPIFGRTLVGFIAGHLCSMACRDRAVEKARKASA